MLIIKKIGCVKKLKIRVISSREEIPTIMQDEKIVHIAFRPSGKDIMEIMTVCPELEAIELPESYITTVSKSVEMFLEMHKIKLIEGTQWGFRRDLSDSRDLSDVEEKIHLTRIECQQEEQIKKKIIKENNLSVDTATYLMEKCKF